MAAAREVEMPVWPACSHDTLDVRKWQGCNRMVRHYPVPVSAINISARRMMARYLDVTRDTFSLASGMLQDWRGLGECLGLDMEHITNLEVHQDRTYHILEQWQCSSQATIGVLIKSLESMERYDVLEDSILQTRIIKDVEIYNINEQQRMKDAGLVESHAPLQYDMGFEADYMAIPEDKMLTTGDCPGRKEYFDAFVCYARDDVPFVEELCEHLEVQHGVKLCLPDRDMLLGQSHFTAISYLIKDRCSRMIIILSPSYNLSPECDFMTKFGHSIAPAAMEKKLIPVVIKKPVKVPEILRYITLVDYTKFDVTWFWPKLARSMKVPDVTSSVPRAESWLVDRNNRSAMVDHLWCRSSPRSTRSRDDEDAAKDPATSCVPSTSNGPDTSDEAAEPTMSTSRAPPNSSGPKTLNAAEVQVETSNPAGNSAPVTTTAPGKPHKTNIFKQLKKKLRKKKPSEDEESPSTESPHEDHLPLKTRPYDFSKRKWTHKRDDKKRGSSKSKHKSKQLFQNVSIS